jgi:hypothetical protein
MKTTNMTRTIMVIANLIMRLVRYYNNVRYKNNFDYFIRDIRKEYPTQFAYDVTVGTEPFYQRTLVDNDISSTYAIIKIGDCFIEYSYQKLNWSEELNNAFDDMKKNFISELILLTKSSQSFNSPSIYLKKINNEKEI